MTTFPINANQAWIKAASHEQMNEGVIAVLGMEKESRNTVLPGEENPDTPVSLIERLVTIYEALKPLLGTLATLPLFPKAWRAAFSLFLGAVQAVADKLPEVSAAFKAGKDL